MVESNPSKSVSFKASAAGTSNAYRAAAANQEIDVYETQRKANDLILEESKVVPR